MFQLKREAGAGEAEEGAAELQRDEDAQPLAFSLQSHPAPERPLADQEHRAKQPAPGFLADDRCFAAPHNGFMPALSYLVLYVHMMRSPVQTW